MKDPGQTGLKKDSVSVPSVVVLSVSAAAPAMCLCGSAGALLRSTGFCLPLAFLLATLVMVLAGVSYGQLGRRYNSAGGTYAYVREVLGPCAGFVSGWIYIGVLLCTGVIGSIFARSLHELVPAVPLWAGMLLLLLPAFFISRNGVEMTQKALCAAWLLQMVLMLLPAIRILAARGVPEGLGIARAFIPSDARGLAAGVLVCVWSFVGFEGPAYMGEELRGGSRSIRRAVIWSALAIGLLYAAVCWLWTASMRPEELAAAGQSDAALSGFAAGAGDALGAAMVRISALVSCAGAFFAFSATTPRCLYDMGRSGYLPEAFAALSKNGTPVTALIVYSAVWAAAALYGAYGSTDLLFTLMALFASISYFLICVCHIKDRWHEAGLRPFLLDKLAPVASCVMLLYMIASSAARDLLIAAAWSAAAWLAALVWRRKQ